MKKIILIFFDASFLVPRNSFEKKFCLLNPWEILFFQTDQKPHFVPSWKTQVFNLPIGGFLNGKKCRIFFKKCCILDDIIERVINFFAKFVIVKNTQSAGSSTSQN